MSAEGIHRYLILLVEIAKRAMLLKVNSACTNTSTSVSETDSAQLISCTDQLRRKLFSFQLNGLLAEHELLLDKLECLCMCL